MPQVECKGIIDSITKKIGKPVKVTLLVDACDADVVTLNSFCTTDPERARIDVSLSDPQEDL